MCNKKIKRIFNLENVSDIQEIITHLINSIENMVKNNTLECNNQKEVLSIMININYILIKKINIITESIEKQREKISKKNNFLLLRKYKEGICKRNALNSFIQNKFNEIYNIKINNYSRVLQVIKEYLYLIDLLEKLDHRGKEYIHLDKKFDFDELNKNEKIFEKINQDIKNKLIKISYLLIRISKE